MLTKSNVLRLWASEEYKKLSRKLIANSTGDPLQYTHIRTNITDPNTVEIYDEDKKTHVTYDVDTVINFLDKSMVAFRVLKSKSRSSSDQKYYRGDTNLIPDKSCMKENYISVSENIEDAITFIDDPEIGYLSEITIDPDVKCIKVGVEGELLLQHGCLWEVTSSSTKTYDSTKYKKLIVKIHPPSKKKESNSIYLPCSLLKKRNKYKSPRNNGDRMKQTKKSKQTKQRLSEFYNSYVEEAELLSESLNENRFINTIVEVNNISNSVKRRFFSKKKRGVSTNLSSNSNKVNGVRKKYKLRSKQTHKTKTI